MSNPAAILRAQAAKQRQQEIKRRHKKDNVFYWLGGAVKEAIIQDAKSIHHKLFGGPDPYRVQRAVSPDPPAPKAEPPDPKFNNPGYDTFSRLPVEIQIKILSYVADCLPYRDLIPSLQTHKMMTVSPVWAEIYRSTFEIRRLRYECISTSPTDKTQLSRHRDIRLPVEEPVNAVFVHELLQKRALQVSLTSGWEGKSIAAWEMRVTEDRFASGSAMYSHLAKREWRSVPSYVGGSIGPNGGRDNGYDDFLKLGGLEDKVVEWMYVDQSWDGRRGVANEKQGVARAILPDLSFDHDMSSGNKGDVGRYEFVEWEVVVRDMFKDAGFPPPKKRLERTIVQEWVEKICIWQFCGWLERYIWTPEVRERYDKATVHIGNRRHLGLGVHVKYIKHPVEVN